VAVDDEVGVVGVGVVGLDVGVVADAEGDADVDTVCVGAALVGGASCVGLGDVRLGVGWAEPAAVVCGAVSRLVPGEVPPAAVARTDAVAGGTTWPGCAGDFVAPVIVTEFPPAVSSTATIAPTPQRATPTPAAARRRWPRLNPPVRSG
jgi:hypothetical protein